MDEDCDLTSSTLIQKLQNKLGKKYKVLFTDIDDTYLCSASLGKSKTIKATHILTDFLNKHSIPVIAVTARSIQDVQHGYISQYLPKFDAIASSLGTELWLRDQHGKYVQDKSYYNKILNDTGYKRDKIHAICKQFIKQARTLYPHMRIIFQFQDKESNIEKARAQQELLPFKISMNFRSSPETAHALNILLKKILSKKGLPKVKTVLSIDKKKGPDIYRYNFDVVAATKDMAVSYIQKKYNCKGIVAGDSGNDKNMILRAGDAAIVVGKCKQDLREIVQKHAVRKHKYISSIQNEGNNRIVYIEPQNSKLEGPQSILNALVLFMELKILLHNFNPFQFNWEKVSVGSS